MSKNGRDGRDGRNGMPGIPGRAGAPGPVPNHEWDGTKVRFERELGEYGPFVDLRGDKGPKGDRGEQGERGDKGEPGVDGEVIKEIVRDENSVIVRTSSGATKGFSLPKVIHGKEGKPGKSIKGEKGDKGDTGEGVPKGGTEGEVLTKNSSKDFDTSWKKPIGGGGIFGGNVGRFVKSVMGLDTDNTDPYNPIVKVSVDGVTITGAGTPGDPLVSAASTSSGHIILDHGTPLPNRVSLNFEGAGVTATDDSGNNQTVITIDGSGSSVPLPGNVTYDSSGQITEVALTGGNTYEVEYNSDGTIDTVDDGTYLRTFSYSGGRIDSWTVT